MQCWGNNGSGQAPRLSIAPLSLNPGILRHEYTVQLNTSGGNPPYYYTLSSGVLPPGMTLHENGALSGAPLAPGTSTFSVRSMDVNFFASFRSYSLNIALNQNPLTQPDSAAVPSGLPLAIDVLANDQDPDGDRLLLANVGAPAHGGTRIAAGKVEYTSTPGFVGTDEFSYLASDPYGGSHTGTVTMQVKHREYINFLPMLKN